MNKSINKINKRGNSGSLRKMDNKISNLQYRDFRLNFDLSVGINLICRKDESFYYSTLPIFSAW